MADPRRLREILGFGYGAPSSAMSALEPFHAGMDPAYMPQDVVTESPGDGPSSYVRSGLESLLGLFAPSDRAAAETADKLNAVADFNPLQGAYDIGKGIGDAVQGGDKLSLAMSMIPGKAADDLVPAVKAAQKSIRAYHGTPHSFEKFDISKIGTGEGAQAYGHGLYFAENEGVAKGYRDTLTDNPSAKRIRSSGGDVQAAIANAKQNIANMEARIAEGSKADNWSKRLQQEQSVLADLEGGGNAGHMYEVNINADPDAFLDWDKPLSEQPQGIRDVYSKLTGHPSDTAAIAERMKAINLEMDEMAMNRDPRTNMMVDEKRWHELAREKEQLFPVWDAGQSGSKIYNAVVDQTDKAKRGSMPYKERAVKGAEQLRKAGIPGIKYLDAGSRTGGEGSRNYVVFSDEIIDIVKKYGIAGALGAGLITQQMADQLEAQQGGGQS